MSLPFSNIRVLDVSVMLPGPFCSLLLADLGAEVLKIERPGGGDPLRETLPGTFWAVNRNKQSLALDVRSPEGLAVLMKLARTSDVLVEGSRPGVAAALGYGYEQVREVNPRLIYCSVTGYGQQGPWQGRPGHDINYLAVSGVLGIPGESGTTPTRPGLPIADLSTAMYAALSIAAALRARGDDGPGQYLDVSITDCLLAWSSVRLGHLLLGGDLRTQDELPHLSPTNRTFATRDGRRIAIGAFEQKFWKRLCGALGCESWLADSRFRTPEARRRHAADLAPMLERAFAADDLQSWLTRLIAADVPCAPVLEPAEAYASDHVRARGLLVADDGDPGRRHVPYPVAIGGERSSSRRPPALGEHTDLILAEAGYSADDLVQLRRRGVIQGPTSGEAE